MWIWWHMARESTIALLCHVLSGIYTGDNNIAQRQLSVAEWLACLTAMREDPSSNNTTRGVTQPSGASVTLLGQGPSPLT